MICKACQVEGETSTVTDFGGVTTDVYCPPYYDEKGVYHHHDINTTVVSYRCSRGHSWRASTVKPCPAADCLYGKPSDTPGGTHPEMQTFNVCLWDAEGMGDPAVQNRIVALKEEHALAAALTNWQTMVRGGGPICRVEIYVTDGAERLAPW